MQYRAFFFFFFILNVAFNVRHDSIENDTLRDSWDPEYHLRGEIARRERERTGSDKTKARGLIGAEAERSRHRVGISAVRATRDFREFRERLFVIQTFMWYIMKMSADQCLISGANRKPFVGALSLQA